MVVFIVPPDLSVVLLSLKCEDKIYILITALAFPSLQILIIFFEISPTIFFDIRTVFWKADPQLRSHFQAWFWRKFFEENHQQARFYYERCHISAPSIVQYSARTKKNRSSLRLLWAEIFPRQCAKVSKHTRNTLCAHCIGIMFIVI